ncbi:MAG: M15 family metallopeptidase [Erysipelotrichaceae bacterium]|nr:M15 family metallopeptidase [Erysipelotrichaceae bacterium]
MKKFLFSLLLIVLLVLLAATALIGEIWKKGETDDYRYPEAQLVTSETLKVGDSWEIPEILLGENEKIDHLEVSDGDILKLDGQTVTALATFYKADVKVYTSEIEIPKKQPRYESVVLFGHDLTGFLNGFRGWVRNLLGVEKKQPERTELRMLNIYEYDFEVSGLAEKCVTSKTLSVNVGETTDASLNLPQGSFVSSIHISDPNLIKAEEKEGSVQFTGLDEGEARVSFFISRYKTLSEEQYAEYCQYKQEKGEQPSADREKVEIMTSQIDCNITVKKPREESSSGGEKVYFTTSKGFTGYSQNGVTYIEGLLVVNKTYSLPSTYGKGLTSQTTAAFNEMKAAAAGDGITLSIVSGYRSYSYQVDLYNRYVRNEGKEKADGHSARPGHSEHQAGLAMDINSLSQSFDQTPEFAWLQANAYKYGFIMRYPKDTTDLTGYIYEPWHYRYVGKSWAEIFYNNGNWITVEEYFGITSRYAD